MPTLADHDHDVSERRDINVLPHADTLLRPSREEGDVLPRRYRLLTWWWVQVAADADAR